MSDATQPKPHFKTVDLRDICRKIDKEIEKPEVVYEFSNKRQFVSTDRGTTGVYDPNPT